MGAQRLKGPVRAILFAGEPFPIKLLRRLYEHWPARRALFESLRVDRNQRLLSMRYMYRLMNTRGLVALIVLNIGLDLGVLSSTMFALLVIMALVTTMIASPLLSFLGYKHDITCYRTGKQGVLSSSEKSTT